MHPQQCCSGRATRAAPRTGRARLVVVVVFLGLAFRPAPSAAQVSFAAAGHVAADLAAPRAVVSAADAGGAHATSMVPTWSYVARSTVAIARWLEVETAQHAVLAAVQPADSVATELDRPVARSEAAAMLAAGAIATADRYVGARYRWGGDSPAEGFDCSGFVRFVFARQGISLPRTSRAQAHAGRSLSTNIDDLLPGDLLFFAQGGPTIDHVAIYAGEGRIVHSSSRGGGVRSDEISAPRGRWYMQHLVGVRRVIDDGVVPPPATETAPEAVPLGHPVD